MSREPVDVFVLLQQEWLLLSDIHEPRRYRPIHDPLLAPRVKGILVPDVLNPPDDPSLRQVFSDVFIARPDFSSFIDAVEVIAIIVNDVEWRYAISFTELKVIFTIRRRNVHDARARLSGDEICWVDMVNLSVLRVSRAGV